MGPSPYRPMFLNENLLVIHANRSHYKQKILGTQHHFKRKCGTASFVEFVESDTFGATGGSGWPERKKSAQVKRGHS